jgi:vacuolar-type H+-ATPase subunit C/Vma6
VNLYIAHGKLKEIVERISNIVETATQLVTEKEDLVDSVSASRQMKHVGAALKEFTKSANEVMIHERRMEAAFEDIAEGIQKYFNIGLIWIFKYLSI